jgi:hypothetical protein
MLTEIILNKLSDLFGMMNVAIIKDNNTSWTRIRVCKWHLENSWVSNRDEATFRAHHIVAEKINEYWRSNRSLHDCPSDNTI